MSLAPLVLFEPPAGGGPSEARPVFGRLVARSDGTLTLAAGPAAVYHGASPGRLGELEVTRYHYVWWIRTRSDDPAATRWQPQGYRLTVDGDGFPRIWEVLREPQGLRVLYVSESLEASAGAHGLAPLPGRRFALERAIAETPDVTVARALSDAPVPLGPWVYVEYPGDRVSTLLCRCMPSQMGSSIELETYDLIALSSLPAVDPGLWEPPVDGVPQAPIPPVDDPAWPASALRLPPVP